MTPYDDLDRVRRRYLSRLSDRFRRVLVYPFVIAIIAGGVWAVDLLLVYYEWGLGLPPGAADYMLETRAWDFSNTRIESEILGAGRSRGIVLVALAIYWSYWIATAIMVLIFPFMAWLRQKYPLAGYQKGLLLTHFVSALVERLELNSSRTARLILRHLTRSNRLYGRISPIRARWYERPEHKWLKPDSLTDETRDILFSVSQFETSLHRATELDFELYRFIDPLNSLKAFFFTTAVNSDPELEPVGEIYDLPNPTDCLTEFTSQARPLSVTLAREWGRLPRTSSVTNRLSEALMSSVAQKTAGFSILSGIVMLLGVVLFRIDSSAAFLTWFTVTFGSLVTLSLSSVGVENGSESEE